VAPTHRALFVVEDVELLLQATIDVFRDLRHPLLLRKREHGRFDWSQPGVKLHDHPWLWRPSLIGSLIFRVRLTQEGQCRPIRASGRFNHVWNESFLRHLIQVGEVLAAAPIARVALGVLLHDQDIPLPDKLSAHVTSQVEVSSVSDSLQLTELAGAKKWERVLNVSGATRVVAQFFVPVLTQLQSVTREPQVGVPAKSTVAPVLVPLYGLAGMAEELNLHLLEF